MLRKLYVMFFVAAVVLPSAAQAKFFQFGLNETEVKEIVKQYLLENPEIVKDALDNYVAKEMEMRNAAMVSKLDAHRGALERDPATPVIGNPNGDVTIVEFFDYNCGYCKLMFPKVLDYVQKDGNIRWVLKDMPTLSETSDLAARAGLAAAKQGKYLEMHQALMLHKGHLEEADIVAAAKGAGLDMDKFAADIKDPAFDQQLQANQALAAAFEFRGIPNFIIGDFISNGAMMNDELEVNVPAARAKAAGTN